MKKEIKICKGMSCTSKGSGSIENKLKDENIEAKSCTCTGHCHKGPNIRVDSKVVHNISREQVLSEIENPTDFSDGNTQGLDFDLDELTKL